MNLRRLRGPLLAAIGTMLLAGGSVALATDPSSTSTSSAAEEPGSDGPDTDNVQFEDQSGADDAAEVGGAEAEAAGPDTDNVEFEDQSGAPD